jgi:hypothetical protein
MTISCITRWVGVRAAAQRGKAVPDLAPLDREASAIISRFPCAEGVKPSRRQGYSLVTHKGNRTGREILSAHLDAWAREIEGLPATASPAADDDVRF